MTPKKNRNDRIPDDLIDQLLANYEKPEDLTGEGGLLKELTARLLSRALEGEMTEHLVYEKHAIEGRDGANSRNGTIQQTAATNPRGHERGAAAFHKALHGKADRARFWWTFA